VVDRAYLGIGSNVGDRLANLVRAVELLDGEAGIAARRTSRVWETDPVGGPPQPDFLNAVIEVETDRSPRDLLAACHRVESALGRVRETRWGPRTIDLDILLFDDLAVDETDLTIPHPRMIDRAFVLMPLLELQPDVRFPDGRRLADVRLGPNASAGARPFSPPLKAAG
jgi:2-amino-4-hydroxy-6-hydroxymethyldihydropteridine diphosphokinase